MEPNPEWLDHLKRQPEWEAVVEMFYRDRERIKEKMLVSDYDGETLKGLAIQGGIIDYYLTWALDAPKDEEG